MKKTAVKTAANLVRQPHGGALAKGGYRGNKGGGRPPSALREAFRGDLETARARIAELLEDPDTKPSDIISIFDKLAKYSMREKEDVVVMTPTVMKELATAVKRFVTDKAAQDQIKDEWIEVLRRHLV